MPIYREPLPENCPPEEAAEISNRRIVFRLVRNNPPMDADFRSQRAENPEADFNIGECIARGLSVFSERSVLERQLRKPRHRGKAICQVTLERGAGFIKQTGQNRHHYTWWPLSDFDIPAHCQAGL